MNKWFYTDDLQICRKEKGGYEFIEFTQADDDVFLLSEREKIIIANWKDSDGEWDADAISIIKGYYRSLDGLRKCGYSEEDEEQVVAECIYEQTITLAHTLPFSKAEAEKYLEKIMKGELI